VQKEKKRRGIQSVGIGMKVLSTVAGMTGASSLTSIAAKAGLSASKTHRYLSSLVAANMLKQDPHSGYYDLDAGAIRIGLAALSRIDAFSAAGPFVEGLVARTNRTAAISVWGDAGPTIMRWFKGNPPVITSMSIGSTMPLLRSATGQIFFAFGHRSEVDAHARREIAGSKVDFGADLEALRAAVGARCMAINSGDFIPGLRVAAAPVFDLQGSLVLVVALLASASFAEGGDEESQRALLDTCQQLTRSLGGRWPDGKRVNESLQPPPAPVKSRGTRGSPKSKKPRESQVT
jgi:DNA-binding IclR family transcriptional regulator